MVKIRTHLAALFLLAAVTSYLPAQVPTAQLLKEIEAGKTQYKPVTSDRDLTVSRYQAQYKLYELDKYLHASGSANRKAWKNFLVWDAISAELAKPNADGHVLLELADNLKENEKGLELGPFTRAREALEAHAHLLIAATDKDQEKIYNETLDRLGAGLQKFDAEPTVDNALQIALLLSWLESRRQQPQLVEHVKTKFNRPNAQVYFSSRVIGQGVNRHLQEPQKVSDRIMKTEICGDACLIGDVVMKTVPCQNHARLEVDLTGVVTSQTYGYQKMITVRSQGTTSVDAHKTLDLTPDRLCGFPACAHCETDNTICSVTSSKLPRLIEPMAWKKAQQQLPQAEQIASQHAEQKIEARMDEESTRLIARNNLRLAEMKHPLIRRNAVPQLHFSSTNSHLIATASRAGHGQVGGYDAPPAAKLDYDVVGQVHETAIVNFGESFMGGVTLTDERVAKMVKERTGSVPEELQITQDKEPWSITFANHIPLRVRFEQDTVKITIRVKSLARGDNKFSELTDISAAYAVNLTDNGSELTRQGDVEVKFVHLEMLGLQQTAAKTFLKRKFESLFKPEIKSEGLVLKGEFERFGKLQMKSLAMGTGWATVGLNMVANNPPSPKTTPVPDPGSRIRVNKPVIEEVPAGGIPDIKP